MGLVIFLIVAGWRYVRRVIHPWPTSVRAFCVALIVGSAVFYFVRDTVKVIQDSRTEDFASQRQEAIERIMRQGLRHLVIVRYSEDHDIHTEWVYNRANIDGSEIIWARDMGQARNVELLEYYRDRKIWLLEPDVNPFKLTEYPALVEPSQPSAIPNGRS